MFDWLSKYIFYPIWEIKDGAHRLKYLRELTNSQWWNFEQLRQKQWTQLCTMVKYAYDHCPYYRSSYEKIGFDGMLSSWEDFNSLPLLTKSDIRENAEYILSDRFVKSNLLKAKTGGSTGHALTVYFDQKCQEMRNAAAMRSDRWAGWDMGMKVAAVWGNPPVADTFKKKLRNTFLDRFLYLDTMHINEANILVFINNWRSENPKILFGHAHSIYILATYLKRLDIKDLRPRGIIATSMMLIEPERRVIESVFGCHVTNRYGCEEVGLIACECEKHSGLHLNIDHLVVEFLKDDSSAALLGEEANIVVTDLINYGMPLIRYSIEDKGVISNRMCSCGRGLPLVDRIVGRQADFLKRLDGSLVAGISLIERTLTAIPGLAEMQLIQDELERICVKVVKDSYFNETSESDLRRELQIVFGKQVQIEISFVSALSQTVAGKHRFVINNIK